MKAELDALEQEHVASMAALDAEYRERKTQLELQALDAQFDQRKAALTNDYLQKRRSSAGTIPIPVRATVPTPTTSAPVVPSAAPTPAPAPSSAPAPAHAPAPAPAPAPIPASVPTPAPAPSSMPAPKPTLNEASSRGSNGSTKTLWERDATEAADLEAARAVRVAELDQQRTKEEAEAKERLLAFKKADEEREQREREQRLADQKDKIQREAQFLQAGKEELEEVNRAMQVV